MRGRKPQEIIGDQSAVDACPRPPAWLSKHGKAEWRRVVPLLVSRRILTDADMGTLESYVTAIGNVRECQEEINARGLIVETEKGPKRNPAFGIQNAAMTTARLCAAELGLTPVSRSRPSIRDEEDADDESAALGL